LGHAIWRGVITLTLTPSNGFRCNISVARSCRLAAMRYLRTRYYAGE
jgi:hypothetical protein